MTEGCVGSKRPGSLTNTLYLGLMTIILMHRLERCYVSMVEQEEE